MQEKPAPLPEAALVALEQGNMIEAIKITREQTGLGLKEAKDAVDAHAGKQPARVTAQTAGDVPTAAVVALGQGDLIGAIKLTRTALGLGLKDAKETVEMYLANHPQVQVRFAAAQATKRRSAILNLLGAVALGVVIYALLKWLKILS